MAPWLHGAAGIAARPWLWATALVQYRRMVGRGWWRRRPYLPVPDAHYVRFRHDTAYGANGRPDRRDLVRYLTWCRDTERAHRAHRAEVRAGRRR